MTVEPLAHVKDMTEQLMIAKGLDRPGQVVEQAIMAMYAQLSDEQKSEALQRMIQAGFDSGPSGLTVEEVFDRIFARLDAAETAEGRGSAAA